MRAEVRIDQRGVILCSENDVEEKIRQRVSHRALFFRRSAALRWFRMPHPHGLRRGLYCFAAPRLAMISPGCSTRQFVSSPSRIPVSRPVLKEGT
jgi:hypothetical protein